MDGRSIGKSYARKDLTSTYKECIQCKTEMTNNLTEKWVKDSDISPNRYRNGQ